MPDSANDFQGLLETEVAWLLTIISLGSGPAKGIWHSAVLVQLLWSGICNLHEFLIYATGEHLKPLRRSILDFPIDRARMEPGTLHEHLPLGHHPQQHGPCAGKLLPLLQNACGHPSHNVTPNGEEEGLPQLVASNAVEGLPRNPVPCRWLLHRNNDPIGAGDPAGILEGSITKPHHLNICRAWVEADSDTHRHTQLY